MHDVPLLDRGPRRRRGWRQAVQSPLTSMISGTSRNRGRHERAPGSPCFARIFTNDEVRRLDGYVDSFCAIIKGIEALPIRRKATPWSYDQQARYEAPGRIETTPRRTRHREGVRVT